MRDTIKGACIGGLVAAFASVVLAQTWTTPRTWATDDLMTADQFNVQFRDNLLWLRGEALNVAVADDAVGIAQLKFGTNTASGEDIFATNAYSMTPYWVSGAACGLRLTTRPEFGSGIHGYNPNFCDNTSTYGWRFFTASDTPSVWVVVSDAGGSIRSMWEGEDPISVGDTVSPLGLPEDDNDVIIPGYTAVNVGLPSLAVIERLYASIPRAALACTRDYVTGRGWLDSLSTLADLATITARYEPSGRQWAMRCGAQASDKAVTDFYLDNLVVDAGVWVVAP